jgi:hypothetical protein
MSEVDTSVLSARTAVRAAYGTNLDARVKEKIAYANFQDAFRDREAAYDILRTAIINCHGAQVVFDALCVAITNNDSDDIRVAYKTGHDALVEAQLAYNEAYVAYKPIQANFETVQSIFEEATSTLQNTKLALEEVCDALLCVEASSQTN